MKKGCLIALAAGLALVVIIILLAFGLTRGAVKAGNEFLGLIGSGKIAAAYESSSATLKSQQSVGSFEQAVKNLGLTDFTSASWSSRETKNDRARLEGSVKTRSGGKIPLTMELVKESGMWKVIYLSAPQAGVSVEQGGKQLPSDEKSKALALDSLLAFNKAVQDKSFVGFHQQISRRWQEQITPDKLKEVFNQFVEKQIDISRIKEVEPILNAAPQINSDGLLVLEGYYPTHSNKIYFRLKYTYEHPAWKLLRYSSKRRVGGLGFFPLKSYDVNQSDCGALSRPRMVAQASRPPRPAGGLRYFVTRLWHLEFQLSRTLR